MSLGPAPISTPQPVMTPGLLSRNTIPSNFAYSAPDLPIGASKVSGLRVRSDQQSYSAGNTVRITIPADCDFVDFSNAYLAFDLTISRTSPDYTLANFVLPSNPVASVIRQMRVQYASAEVENNINYGRLHAIMNNVFTNKSYLSGAGNWLSGCGDIQSRIQHQYGGVPSGTSTTAHYTTKLYHGLMAAGYPWSILAVPVSADLVNNAVIQFQLTLDSVNAFLEEYGAGSVGLTYTMSNVELVYDAFFVPEDFRKRLRDEIAAKGLAIPYQAYNYYGNSIGVNNTAYQAQISDSSTSIIALISAMSATASINSVVAINKYTACLFNDLAQYQAQVGSYQFPTQPAIATDGVELAMAIANWMPQAQFRLTGDDIDCLNLDDWFILDAGCYTSQVATAGKQDATTTIIDRGWDGNAQTFKAMRSGYDHWPRAVVVNNLARFRLDHSVLLSGANQSRSARNMVLSLWFATAVPANTQLDTYVHHDRILLLGANGVARILM